MEQGATPITPGISSTRDVSGCQTTAEAIDGSGTEVPVAGGDRTPTQSGLVYRQPRPTWRMNQIELQIARAACGDGAFGRTSCVLPDKAGSSPRSDLSAADAANHARLDRRSRRSSTVTCVSRHALAAGCDALAIRHSLRHAGQPCRSLWRVVLLPSPRAANGAQE